MKKQKAVHSAFNRIFNILLALTVVMVVYIGATAAYNFGYRLFAEKPMSLAPGIEKVVVIEEGMGVGEVADMLEESGVIRDALIFKVQNRFSHYTIGFQAGTYTVNTSMTNEEIMAVLSGETV